MESTPPKKLSTSALAKTLDLPTQQLFSTFKDYGWIRKVDDGWALTGKGEFEGGEYVHSKRFGRYIVWPQELIDHPLLSALEDNRHLSATALGKPYGLSARETNRVLAELGWLRQAFHGWVLTDLGKSKGGIVLENENSGTSYAVWPHHAGQDLLLTATLQLNGALFAPAEQSVEGDLFADAEPYRAVDGHLHDSRLKLQLCQWLYLAGIAHACRRRLPVDDELYADFYLPAYHLYIECWESVPGELAQRMRRKAVYEQCRLNVIELDPGDAAHLDDVLTRELRKAGAAV